LPIAVPAAEALLLLLLLLQERRACSVAARVWLRRTTPGE